MLDAFGIDAGEGLERLRFSERLRQLTDVQVDELEEFFELDRHAEDPWESGFRLFVSHVAASVRQLLPLAQSLRRYGIVPFLAHEQIAPGARWHDVLLRALRSAHGVLSVHADGFGNSPWCNQEIGIAIGRDLLVIPVRAGEDPSGFVAEIQAVRWNPEAQQTAIDNIVTRLRNDPRTSSALSEALSRQLKFSGSFDRSDFLVAELQEFDELSPAARRQCELALKFNDQVQGRGNAMALLAA